MLQRIYANNYKCLVNAETELEPLTLFLGPNGSGKSAIFDVLFELRAFLNDRPLGVDVFQPETITRWVKSNVQTFEIDFEGNGGLYEYTLQVEHDLDGDQTRVRREKLTFDDKPLFEFETGKVQQYRDDHSEGSSFRLDWSSSGLANVLEGSDNKKLVWFRETFLKTMNVQLLAPMMGARAQDKKSSNFTNDPGLQHFASWYRANYQEYPGAAGDLFDSVRKVLPGFKTAKLADFGGGQRVLELVMKNEEGSGTHSYRFDELSDGERALFVLYSLLHFQGERGAPLLIDEPANYVGLEELRPYLHDLEDYTIDGRGQAILISHHPKILDFLGTSNGRVFRRGAGQPTRIDEYDPSGKGPDPISELMERGELEDDV